MAVLVFLGREGKAAHKAAKYITAARGAVPCGVYCGVKARQYWPAHNRSKELRGGLKISTFERTTASPHNVFKRDAHAIILKQHLKARRHTGIAVWLAKERNNKLHASSLLRAAFHNHRREVFARHIFAYKPSNLI